MSLPVRARPQPYHAWVLRAVLAVIALLLAALVTSGGSPSPTM